MSPRSLNESKPRRRNQLQTSQLRPHCVTVQDEVFAGPLLLCQGCTAAVHPDAGHTQHAGILSRLTLLACRALFHGYSEAHTDLDGADDHTATAADLLTWTCMSPPRPERCAGEACCAAAAELAAAELPALQVAAEPPTAEDPMPAIATAAARPDSCSSARAAAGHACAASFACRLSACACARTAASSRPSSSTSSVAVGRSTGL
eukprot:CAMPEP_0202880764 /NCGR_PEP_ID=MMETSP1391-20130828/35517_1 /ASSEMBLY_ACC=CAM_ASM_000867 /TAXON_ID=1034604 /ORGANISM="Chlamydomonas leiostraca, Strain SAG 11-49" /LENGTH=204 /DNA_ID=CAMNT_0049563311 /DNA_START=751 /DNA_END=1366 /DNA_ORIENTATION=+